MSSNEGHWTLLFPVLAIVGLATAWFVIGDVSNDRADSLVVYCAHDSVYADEILKGFERESGIRVDVRYDTEATKSLGLINLIVAEKNDPRCDLFWNNELLGTVELQSRGLLEPYKGTGWERIPERYRDSDGHWVGFGARLRVSIVNTKVLQASEETIRNLFEFEPARASIAKPLFGTTLTHYTVLWSEWGSARLKQWHYDLRSRGVREVQGNAAVKDVVAQGVCDVGLTDTDDFFVAKDEGQPVDMIPYTIGQLSKARQADRDDENVKTAQSVSDEQATICIPNTVAIIRRSKHQETARRLLDYLTSEKVELALARSKSRQVPLGPVDESQLPDDVKRLREAAQRGIDLRPLLDARRECLEWLKSEYLK